MDKNLATPPTHEEFIALKRDAAQNDQDATRALQGDKKALDDWREAQRK